VNFNYQEAITFDNADFRLYANCGNLIVSAKIGVGLERDADTKIINELFMSGFEIPSFDRLKDVLPNKYDDSEAQKYDNYQSLYTLQRAFQIIFHEDAEFRANSQDTRMAQDRDASGSSNENDDLAEETANEAAPQSSRSKEEIEALY